MPIPATSRLLSSTANAGCCGTTGEKAMSSRSAWRCTTGKTWASEEKRGRESGLNQNDPEPAAAPDRPRDTRSCRLCRHSRGSRQVSYFVRPEEPLRMANMSYLCVTNAKTTYPSWPPRRFDLNRQTVACAVYSVPLLWTALFHSADIVRKTLTLDGEKIVTEAP